MPRCKASVGNVNKYSGVECSTFVGMIASAALNASTISFVDATVSRAPPLFFSAGLLLRARAHNSRHIVGPRSTFRRRRISTSPLEDARGAGATGERPLLITPLSTNPEVDETGLGCHPPAAAASGCDNSLRRRRCRCC
jgi:hypothetical protein